MRDPEDPCWPDGGERTELQEVADVWRWAYYRWVKDEKLRKHLGKKPVRTLGQAVEEYLRHRSRVVERQTFTNDRAALAHLQDDHHPGTPIERLQPQRTIDRLLGDGYRISTVRVYSAFLSSFWGWLERPYRVRLPAAVRPDIRVWNDDEIQAIRASAEAHGMLLPVDVGLYVGLRAGEIWGMEWADVSGWTVRVRRQWPDRTLKGKRARTAVILKGWSHEAGDGRVCEQGAVDRQRRRLREVIGDAGLEPPRGTWHSLRHTYSRMFLESKPDIRLLQASLGHASIKTTEEAYNWLAPDSAAAIAVRSIHG